MLQLVLSKWITFVFLWAALISMNWLGLKSISIWSTWQLNSGTHITIRIISWWNFYCGFIHISNFKCTEINFRHFIRDYIWRVDLTFWWIYACWCKLWNILLINSWRFTWFYEFLKLRNFSWFLIWNDAIIFKSWCFKSHWAFIWNWCLLQCMINFA